MNARSIVISRMKVLWPSRDKNHYNHQYDDRVHLISLTLGNMKTFFTFKKQIELKIRGDFQFVQVDFLYVLYGFEQQIMSVDVFG